MRAYFVERTERVAIVFLDTGMVGTKDLAPCAECGAASRAPRLVRIARWKKREDTYLGMMHFSLGIIT